MINSQHVKAVTKFLVKQKKNLKITISAMSASSQNVMIATKNSWWNSAIIFIHLVDMKKNASDVIIRFKIHNSINAQNAAILNVHNARIVSTNMQ